MRSKELIPEKFYRLIVPKHSAAVYVSLNQPFEELGELLLDRGLNIETWNEYLDDTSVEGKTHGRTTRLFDNRMILVKMNYFDWNISRICVLEHELNHAARRICDIYEQAQNAKLKDREEAECYISEFLCEEIMSIMRPVIDYNKSERNMAWFYEITHELE